MLLPETRTIILLYEKSGVFANLYRAAGYNVIVIDQQLDGKDARIDVPFMPRLSVYGILSFTPCDHLAASGARWWAAKGNQALVEALSLADVTARFVTVYSPFFWMMENPVGRLSNYYGPPRMTFNPYEYGGYVGGEGYTKRTCLWGNFRIPKKKPVPVTEGSKMHLVSSGPEKKNIRSKTPEGFAKAFFLYNH